MCVHVYARGTYTYGPKQKVGKIIKKRERVGEWKGLSLIKVSNLI